MGSNLMSDIMQVYVIKEYIGSELIDEYEFDDYNEAVDFLNERNSKVDNEFRPPECLHSFSM